MAVEALYRFSGEIMRIVIVEDEKDLAALLAFQLEKEGYRVLTAHDGNSEIGRASCRERV